MLELSIIDASKFETNAKCTIHKSGKLGFSANAIKLLDISNDKSLLFAKDNNNPEEDRFYMLIGDSTNEQGFKINKAGDYYYANTKLLFDSLDYDYVNTTIIFDITATEHIQDGMKIYKLTKREVKGRKGNE